MMSTISLSDAKSRLSALVGDVRKGREFEITHHGKAVARLVPIRAHTRESVARAIAALKECRKGATLGRPAETSLRDLLHQGHKW